MQLDASQAYARHQFVYLQREAWPEVLAQIGGELSFAKQQELNAWAQRDLQLVLARQTGLEQAQQTQLMLGWPLPPRENGDKPRLSVKVWPQQIARRAAPPSLGQVLTLLQQQHYAIPKALSSLAAKFANAAVAVYGSWAWQALTGLPYLHPSSDIDVLLHPTSQTQLLAMLQALQSAAPTKDASVQIDGEIVFPDGSAVAWREWLQARERVLVKNFAAVQMCHRDDLFAQLR